MTAVSDVIIVGAGPVGLTASILLAQRGHAITILEREPETDAVLDEQARALGVDIRSGCGVTDFSQHQDVVAVATDDGHVVEGRYLVACDGANSIVRCLLGVAMTELGFFRARCAMRRRPPFTAPTRRWST